LLALLSSVCFSFIVYIVSYIDIGGHTALMELILPLATCHRTSHCVMILLFIILANKFSLSLCLSLSLLYYYFRQEGYDFIGVSVPAHTHSISSAPITGRPWVHYK